MKTIGRADLLRMLARMDRAEVIRVAPMLGMGHRRRPVVIPLDPRPEKPVDPAPRELGPEARTTFWRVVGRVDFEDPSKPLDDGAGPSMTARELHTPSRPPEVGPPRVRWEDWAARLRRLLTGEAARGRVDTTELVDRYAKHEPIEPLPLERVRHLEGRIRVLVDDTLAARPFAADYELLIDGLVRTFGPERVVVEYLTDGPSGTAAEAVACVATAPDRFLALAEPTRPTGWAALGRALARHRTPTLMLSLGRCRVPAPWRAVAEPEIVSRDDVTRVLELLSFAVVFDAAELRTAVSDVTLAVECAAWNDARVRPTVAGYASIDRKVRGALQQGFLERDVAVRRATIERMAASAPAAHLWAETYLGLIAAGQTELVSESARAAAHRHLEKVARAVESGGFDAQDRDRALAWFEHLDERKGEIDFGADDVMGAWVRRLQHLVDGRTGGGVTARATHRLYVRGGYLTSTGSVIDMPIDLRAQRAKVRVERLAPSWATRAGTDDYGRWATFEVGGVEQKMRWIPGGTFWMGSPEDEEGRNDDELRHEVTLSEGYWLADTPCTQAMWSAVMEGGAPSRFEGPRRPVERVSFDDVQRFIGRLEAMVPGLEVTLPTEAQWERAARAGGEDDRYGPLDDVAWFDRNSGRETRDVGTKSPNTWGLHDMLGNVFEWCVDGAEGILPDPYPEGPVHDPVALQGGRSVRVVRGGSWGADARRVRAAARLAFPRVARTDRVGFRLARGRAPGPAEPTSSPESAGPRGTRETEPRVGAAHALTGDTNIPIDLSAPVRIETDRMTLELEPFGRPDWASNVGRDKFGLFADVAFEAIESAVRPAVMRMRWIPPGRFVMGSPESELERYPWEGPQHEVVLTAGFWLANAPCTQDVWGAVLGEGAEWPWGSDVNPSRYRSPDRPVESVSFDHVAWFLERVNAKHPGLDLRLPTEAEWEYACRAGTTTALYTGGIEIVGERNAPKLDPIAWYGGNSGVGFDLDEGFDTSDWDEVQYPNSKAGTRRVRTRKPNPWGLHDMLGNVYEWCVDGADRYEPEPYSEKPVEDPVIPWRERPARVVRGGSWHAYARYIRAASRDAFHREVCSEHVGFRLARGRAPGGGSSPSADPSSDRADHG